MVERDANSSRCIGTRELERATSVQENGTSTPGRAVRDLDRATVFPMLRVSNAIGNMKKRKRKLSVGDWVEVRSREEILKTLDANGRLDGMSFMPEMFSFCGKRFQVYKRAHKTCDTVFPVRGRRVDRAVHLDTRCDGSAHGGCQAECLIFWKEAWLKLVSGRSRVDASPDNGDKSHVSPAAETACSEQDVSTSAEIPDPAGGPPVYVCQATQLPYATSDLEWWDIRQYIEDYTSGNVGLWRIVCGFAYSAYYNLSIAGIGVGRAMRWFYDAFHPLWRGTPFPRREGLVPEGHPTPTTTLNIQAGELVRVKSHDEILKTVGTNNKNRGMYWDAELVPYCGGTYRVLKRVTRIIDEKTGKMQELKNPCIMLDSVVCQSRYSHCRMFCPRSIYSYWREIWLERVEPTSACTKAFRS
jgi:hypothetical protein